MTDSAPQPPIEQAADDLLLLLARLETPGVPVPGPEEVMGVLVARVGDAMPAVARYARRHGPQASRHASFGFSTATDVVVPAATGHLLLSLRLLVWTAHRTGLSHAEVVAEVLAQTDVDEGD